MTFCSERPLNGAQLFAVGETSCLGVVLMERDSYCILDLLCVMVTTSGPMAKFMNILCLTDWKLITIFYIRSYVWAKNDMIYSFF